MNAIAGASSVGTAAAVNAATPSANAATGNAPNASPDFSNTDFLSLVKLFLSSQSAEDLPTAPLAKPATQIADAMIRSMLGSSRTPAPVPHQTNARVVQDSNAHSAAVQAALVVPPVLAAFTQSPLIRSVDTARVPAGTPGKGAALKLPATAIAVSPAAVAKTSSAPVAFTMRLTPESVPEPTARPNSGSDAVPAVINDVPAASPEVEPQSQAQPEQKPAESKQSVAAVEPKAHAESHADSTPIVAGVTAPTASSDDSSFARQMPNLPATPAQTLSIAKTAAAPVASSSEALRASEPASSASPQQPASPVREIAVRVSAPQSPAVDVQLTERAGQVHVAVRTGDGNLQASLRQDLASLVNSLERSGFRAEAFTPREGALQSNSISQTSTQNSRQDSESGSGGRGAQQDLSQNAGGGQQQRQRDPRPRHFIEELENQA